MALGEAALLAQSSMWLAVWCAIFGLPTLYLQCRHILDVLVEEALQLVAAFLKAGLHLVHCVECFALHLTVYVLVACSGLYQTWRVLLGVKQLCKVGQAPVCASISSCRMFYMQCVIHC